MTNHYLDLHDIAQLAGITDASARQYHKRATANRQAGDLRPGDMPAPDVVVGSRKQAMKPGWTEEAIMQWLRNRPRKSEPASNSIARNWTERHALAAGLRNLIEHRFGTPWPTSPNKWPNNNRPYDSLPWFTVKCRNAFTNREGGLTEEQERVWGVGPDELHEIDVRIHESWDDSPLISDQIAHGRDPGREWLYGSALHRVPLGMVPIAIAMKWDKFGTITEWYRLPDTDIDEMVRVVREQNNQTAPHPIG